MVETWKYAWGRDLEKTKQLTHCKPLFWNTHQKRQTNIPEDIPLDPLGLKFCILWSSLLTSNDSRSTTTKYLTFRNIVLFYKVTDRKPWLVAKHLQMPQFIFVCISWAHPISALNRQKTKKKLPLNYDFSTVKPPKALHRSHAMTFQNRTQ